MAVLYALTALQAGNLFQLLSLGVAQGCCTFSPSDDRAVGNMATDYWLLATFILTSEYKMLLLLFTTEKRQ